MRSRRKLSNLLLRNYLIASIIMFFIFLVFFFGTIATWVSLYFPINTMVRKENSQLVAKNIITSDYKATYVKEILDINGWIEVLDRDLKVVYSKGERRQNRVVYGKEEFHNMLVNMEFQDVFTEGAYIYSIAYDGSRDFYLLVYLPNDRNLNKIGTPFKFVTVRVFFVMAIVLYIIIFIIIMIIYSKLTSRNLTQPLKELMKGVKALEEGEYSTRINVKSQNEFGELSEAFNLMVQKVEEERTLKEKSEENRRRLILDVSHDLKNPLVSIRGYSNLMLKNPKMGEEERKGYLETIEKNSIRLNDLITDLFQLSKFESTDFKLDIKKENICEFLREVIAMYIPSMEEKGIEYNFHIPEKPIWVSFDYFSMDRAIGNLISNSIRYNSKGITIKILLQEFENTVGIVIGDDGIGIPKNLIDDIFNPFVRVDSSRNSKSGGTGLGLTITQTIIHKHGGNIVLDSDAGKGVKFTIILNK